MTKDEQVSKDTALKMAIEGYEECLENLQGWAAYASEYFQDKWDLEGEVKDHKDKINACKEALEQPAFYDDEEVDAMTAVAHHEGWQKGYNACKSEQLAQEPMELLEALSDLEHQQWIKWAKSIIDSKPISESRKQRWLTMMVDYKDLPDNIQEYDREWARKVMALTYPASQPCQECENLKHDLDVIWEANKELLNREFIGLTDYEIGEMYDEAWMKYKGTKEAAYHLTTGFARAIEQALRNKNT